MDEVFCHMIILSSLSSSANSSSKAVLGLYSGMTPLFYLLLLMTPHPAAATAALCGHFPHKALLVLVMW